MSMLGPLLLEVEVEAAGPKFERKEVSGVRR